MPVAVKCTPCAGRGTTSESRKCPRCAHVRGAAGARSCAYCQGTMQKTSSCVCWKCNGRGMIPRPTMAWSGLGRNGRAPIEPERKPSWPLRTHVKTPSADSTSSQESQRPRRSHKKKVSEDMTQDPYWPLGDGAPF